MQCAEEFGIARFLLTSNWTNACLSFSCKEFVEEAAGASHPLLRRKTHS